MPNRKMNILPGDNFDLELFKNPPADCQPSYSWLWNVPVSREAIDRELEEIVRAGEILVIKDGVIAERGVHADLVKAGGTYTELYETQFGKALETQ